MNVDIVIASYKEDLLWTKFLPGSWHKFVYCADNTRTEFPEDISPNYVPNGGREAGQWLEHIVKHYGEFQEYTLFVQGQPLDHSPKALIELMIKENFTGPICYLGALQPSNLFLSLKPQGAMLEILQNAYGDQEVPPMIPFNVGAQFYIRRDVIMANPIGVYQKLLESARSPRYPNFGHLIEPSWGSVFNWVKFI